MSTVAEPAAKSSSSSPAPSHRSHRRDDELRTTPYERTASVIVALIILVGAAVVLLFLVWLTARLLRRNTAVPVEIVEELSGRGDHAAGVARDPEPPGAEEIEELIEPQTEQSVEAVTDAVSSIAGSMTALLGGDVMAKGGGLGDSRRAGPLGEGEDIIPRSERWKFQYPNSTLKQYAAILDYFKIELGALGGGVNQVDYAFNLSKSQPDRRSGTSEQEKRLFFIWTGGRLQEADRELLSKAGIRHNGRIIAQFVPEETENLLAQVERAFANRPARDIRQTVFGVRRKGSVYEFYVIEQLYRR